MSRDITLLHPEVQIIIPKFLEECKKQGLIVKTTDTVRTKQEQDDLYAQGRTKPGKIVTWVKYPYSNHNWGMAFDICRNDGKGAYNDSDGWFAKVGQIGKKFGLTWGGEWKGTPDKPHFELTKYGSTEQLQKKYGTPEEFKKTWKPIEEVEYVVVQRNYEYNNKTARCNVINKDGENYIKVRDIANLLNKTTTYDTNTKITKLLDVTSLSEVIINDECQLIESTLSNNYKFVKLRDICEKLGYIVDYNETNGVVKLTKKSFFRKG